MFIKAVIRALLKELSWLTGLARLHINYSPLLYIISIVIPLFIICIFLTLIYYLFLTWTFNLFISIIPPHPRSLDS
jgi:hypothetical protein